MPGRLSKVDYKKLSGDSKGTKKASAKSKESNQSVDGLQRSDEDLNKNGTVAVDDVLGIVPECSSCKVLAELVRTLLKKHESLDKEFQELKDKIASEADVSDIEEVAKKQISLEKEVNDLKEKITPDGSSVSDHSVGVQEKLKELEKKVEDRTNRQLRKTLVIRNLPESDDEKTWSDTRELVASKFADLLEITQEEAVQLIDRCHRGGNTNYYRKKKRVRPIYVAILRWYDCEDIVQAARSQSEFFIDYKYGPLTTARRNMALKLRKELKAKGEIGSAFVKFPAVLMAKKPGQIGGKYEEIQDFSNEEVNLSRAEEDHA